MINVSDVNNILNPSLTDENSLAPYLSSALVIVSIIPSGTYSDEIIDEITKWLTAHLYEAVSKSVVELENPDFRRKFVDVYSKGLNSTSYGQQVVVFDTKGYIRSNDENRSGKSKITVSLV